MHLKPPSEPDKPPVDSGQEFSVAGQRAIEVEHQVRELQCRSGPHPDDEWLNPWHDDALLWRKPAVPA